MITSSNFGYFLAYDWLCDGEELKINETSLSYEAINPTIHRDTKACIRLWTKVLCDHIRYALWQYNLTGNESYIKEIVSDDCDVNIICEAIGINSDWLKRKIREKLRIGSE